MKAISCAIIAVAGAIVAAAGYIGSGDTSFPLLVGYVAFFGGIGAWARAIISDGEQK